MCFALHDLLRDNVTVSTFCEIFDGSKFGDHLPGSAIGFLAGHIDEFPRALLDRLPISVLSRIVSHPLLTLESEDWLYDFVSSQFHSRPDSVCLLELVRFEFLTPPTIEQFIWWSPEHFRDFEMSLHEPAFTDG